MTNNYQLVVREGNRKSFTLIELLVTLALVAILSVVVVMTLNPAELIKQARDSNRLSDLSTINTALNLFSADVTSGFMGTSTVVYVSIPDNASSTCGSLGLPTLPSGWNYNCVTTANLRNTNGTGWIPVNFQRISSNSPISQLPVDPINTTSTGNYYTYVSGGSYVTTALIESQKYLKSSALTDGGFNPGKIEVGNNLTLSAQSEGLKGWWDFEEGGGTVVIDKSGNGNNLTWYGGGTHYITGKDGLYSGNFTAAAADYLNAGKRISSSSWDGLTYGGWFKSSLVSNLNLINEWSGGANFAVGIWASGKPSVYLTGSVGWNNDIGSTVVRDGTWHQIYVTNGGGQERVYVDGTQIFATTSLTTLGGGNYKFKIGANADASDVPSGFFDGQIDDMRIYNRNFSAPEILALYNATK